MAKIVWELTDTFGGEANYAWVKRGVVELKLGETIDSITNLAIVRRVKAAIDWQGIHCETESWGDDITLRPRGMCQVCFISVTE